MADAVVVDAVRTPLGRRNGALGGVHPAELLGGLLQELVARHLPDPGVVDDVLVGCMEQLGEQANTIGRVAWLAAGLPESVPATTVERQCTSSQQALHFGAQSVLAGACDTVVIGGVESMSRVPMSASTTVTDGCWAPAALHARYHDRADVGGIELSQFDSAELIGRRWEITRADQEAYALRSHERAAAARSGDVFAREIVPVTTPVGIVRDDDGIRVNTSRERMAALPALVDGGTVTAATSSQIADGAAAVLLMSGDVARRAGLRPRARVVAFTAAGHDPIEGLTAVIPATRRVLERAGLTLSDLDAVEINEAFAVVPLAWQRELGADDEWFDAVVNPYGGAIALGHPIGCTGVRLTTTLLNRLDDVDGQYGLQTICGSLGLATALVLERLP
jgi:acetyl-CoA acetyltransferase family protein